jgi:Tfp pilus assembly protein PilV
MRARPSPRDPQRGVALLEALIAFLVLALGMLALVQVPKQLRLRAEIARQQADAVRLAQSEIEALRAFAVMADATGLRSFDAIAAGSTNVEANGTRYVLTRRVAADAGTPAKLVAIDVAWSDRSAAAHATTLATIVAGQAPALGAALGLARIEALALGAAGRSPRVPVVAQNLGDGRSALKPVASGTTALVLDNVTGALVGRCSAVDPALATRDLTRANLGTCDAVAGWLISGTVRFTAAAPPDPAQANDPPLPFTMTALPTSGTDPVPAACASEALKTVAVDRNGNRRLEAVPIAAMPASLGLAAWTETGERFASYHCAVYPGARASWSGRTALQPSGWTIATTAGAWRVCRFSRDIDGSGAIDSNAEHPASYRDLTASLSNQNFLVVAGTAACPSGNNTAPTADLSTAPHQP